MIKCTWKTVIRDGWLVYELESVMIDKSFFISPEAFRDIQNWDSDLRKENMKEYDDLYIVHGGEG